MRRWLIGLVVLFFCYDLCLLVLLARGYGLEDLKITFFPILHQHPAPAQALPPSFFSPQPLGLKFIEKEKISAGRGLKSLLIHPDQKRVYSMNLEGMSVFEFDREQKKLLRKLEFSPTKGKGFNYDTRKWYDSYQEKPVEGCFSHGGKVLWISLHNAGGVVAWDLEGKFLASSNNTKLASLTDQNGKQEAVSLPFFPTGKTPKFILFDSQQKRLYVSNWHDNTLSRLQIQGKNPALWKVATSMLTGAVPRGLALSSEAVIVGHMGGHTLGVFPHDSLYMNKEWEIGLTPRHLLAQDTLLWVSLSSPEKLLKCRLSDGKILQSVSTKDDPRTLAISPDGQLIFVACYADEVIQAFRTHDLALLGEWPSSGRPVGLALHQEVLMLEVWVGNYTAGTINVLKLEVDIEGLVN